MKQILVFAVSLVGMLSSPVLAPGVIFAQLIADPDFNTTVARPAYVKTHPRVLIDEAHANFHTAAGRYKPLADFLSNDGYQVTPLKDKFSLTVLKGYHVLVIANALGAESTSSREWSPDWFEAGAKPAFSEQECGEVREWVHAGGALLLIADHRPFGAAAEILAKRFTVEMSKGYVFDKANLNPKGNYRSELTFTKENRGLADHPVTRGRDESERIHRVMTFVGQSLRGPAGSAAFLRLADTSIDKQDLATSTPEVSAAGRSQGIAMKFGKGRVVILGEAAMLSAQVPLGSKEKERFGMNVPGIDNRQLALDIMHWLSGLLK